MIFRPLEPATAIERIWAAPPPPPRESQPVEILGAGDFISPGSVVVISSDRGLSRIAKVARVEGDKVWLIDGPDEKVPARAPSRGPGRIVGLPCNGVLIDEFGPPRSWEQRRRKARR